MKKVYQTIIDPGHGNCMQAVVASLLELELDDVPNFIETWDDIDCKWEDTLHGFFEKQGYYTSTVNVRPDLNQGTEFLKRVARFDGGVNGYFYASVPSQTFPGVFHAVVVDTDLNIVHDPNPNEKALLLKPEDVIDILVMHDMIIGKTGKLFTKNDWRNASEEERDLNTYKYYGIE